MKMPTSVCYVILRIPAYEFLNDRGAVFGLYPERGLRYDAEFKNEEVN